MNARQHIKLPAPAEATPHEIARYGKESLYINENFKSLYDAVDEMGKKIETLKKQLETLGGN